MVFPWSQVFTYNMHWIPCSLIKSLKKSLLFVSEIGFLHIKELMNGSKTIVYFNRSHRGTPFFCWCLPLKSSQLRQIKWKFFLLRLLVCAADTYSKRATVAASNRTWFAQRKENRNLQDSNFLISLNLLWYHMRDVPRKRPQYWAPAMKSVSSNN